LETVLYSFTKKAQGSPDGGLVVDKAGNLYGGGGTGFGKRGVVFRLSPAGTLAALYRFKGSPDGSEPAGDLLRMRDGTIYGTTMSGGDDNLGTVFQLKPDGTEQVLASFGFAGVPNGGVIADSDGNLYGTTQLDGFGYGTVFELVR
jgi:uncharacterized repeat protein (TIGR03803 family)